MENDLRLSTKNEKFLHGNEKKWLCKKVVAKQIRETKVQTQS